MSLDYISNRYAYVIYHVSMLKSMSGDTHEFRPMLTLHVASDSLFHLHIHLSIIHVVSLFGRKSYYHGHHLHVGILENDIH